MPSERLLGVTSLFVVGGDTWLLHPNCMFRSFRGEVAHRMAERKLMNRRGSASYRKRFPATVQGFP